METKIGSYCRGKKHPGKIPDAVEVWFGYASLEHSTPPTSACGNALNRIGFASYSEQTDQPEELTKAMKRSRLGNLLVKPVESWRRFRGKIPAGSDADIEPPNEDKWPDGTERDQRGRLRQALIFLLNESKFLGYTKVAKHLRRAIDALR
ncbi:hypothetical protein G6L85_24935 [Agrobacterium rhizogenes]|uniref:hypothetical protein n=1 Tax=Rhizobium rhizogenes TaxID=359 RepID=UPI001571ED26|nr:hypothetical protein [Rhizobium rhizogenes]NTI64769.1 hypothetical protein [Rhizobium rhizogenes]